MAEQKEPKDMDLGGLVEKMIFVSIQCDNRLNALDGKGSPYHSEEELRQNIIREYKEIFNPLKEELGRREQLLYKNK